MSKTDKLDKSSFERSSAGYSITLRMKIENTPGSFARILNVIGEMGGSLSEVTLLSSDFYYTIRDVTVNCKNEQHSRELVELVKGLEGLTLLGWQDDTFAMHLGGKIISVSKTPLKTVDELSRAYTPGVARVCMEIHRNEPAAHLLTIKKNTIAVVSDGTAVLGLGDIGPKAAMPVMEGKCVLFKQFGGVDAFPICLDTKDTEEIIRTVKLMAPGLGGINLEDISAPRCFEIEQRLKAELDIPIFHDDQHGTAVVVLAGLINAMKITGKSLAQLRVVINGFGASGVAITKILVQAGVKNIIPCDSIGVVYRGRGQMNSVKEEVIRVTNPENVKGSIADALKGSDVFIGVSRPGTVSREMIASMAKDPIVFALANPIPEILPDEINDIVKIVATGRSDYVNQVNNVLCFPGIFRGALDCNAREITDGMKIAAANAIAETISSMELREDYIIPGTFHPGIAQTVAKHVRQAAEKEGLARTFSKDYMALENPHGISND